VKPGDELAVFVEDVYDQYMSAQENITVEYTSQADVSVYLVEVLTV